MIKLQEIYTKLILESRRKDTIEKYRIRYGNGEDFEEGSNLHDLGFDSYEYLVSWYEDYLPHPKYLDYVLNYSCCGGYGGDPSSIVNKLNDFHRLTEKNFIENKDIYSNEYEIKTVGQGFVDVTSLDKAISLGLAKEKDSDVEKKLKKDRDAVYEDDRWRIVVPKTHESSCYYGAGTMWCTTMKDHPGHFKTYTDNGILFYLIDKSSSDDDVMYKVAVNWKWKVGALGGYPDMWIPLHITEGSTWYAADDKTINKSHVIPLLPNVVKAMFNYYENVIKTHNDKIRESYKDVENIVDTIRQFLVDNDFSEKVFSKIKNKLPKEGVTKINGGISNDIGTYISDDDIGFLWFNYESDISYSLATLGGSEMVGDPQLFEIHLNGDNDNKTEFTETLLNDVGFWYAFRRIARRDSNVFMHGISENKHSLNNFLYKNRETIFNNLDFFVDYTYNKLLNFIKANSWRGPIRKDDITTKKIGDITYWVPLNSASSFAFKYPPKTNSLTHKFLTAIKKKPGLTPKEYYESVGGIYTNPRTGGASPYYSGYNTHFFTSLRDSGIVKREKGPYGEYKYFIGPNYKEWTKGNLKRYTPRQSYR